MTIGISCEIVQSTGKFSLKGCLGSQWTRVSGQRVAYLEVRPLFSNLLEALFDFAEAGAGSDGVHEQEGVGRRDGQPPHGRKLHVARSIQNIHLRAASHDEKRSKVLIIASGCLINRFSSIDAFVNLP